MRTYLLFALLALSLALPLVFAPAAEALSPVMRVDLELSGNGTFVLKNIENSLGTFEESSDRSTPYQILLVDRDDVLHLLTFDETFLRMTDPPSVLDQKMVSKKLPYYGNIGELRIYSGEDLAFKYDMEDLCDLDRVCNGFENIFNCPDDCILEMRESAEKAELYRSMKEKEELKAEDEILLRSKQFAIIITIIFMLVALFLIIILTKGNKKSGKR